MRTELVIVVLLAIIAFSVSGKNITEPPREQTALTKDRISKATTRFVVEEVNHSVKTATTADSNKAPNKS